VRAAIKITIMLNAMTDDRAPAMDASGRQCVNSTFEAVIRVRYILHDHIESFIVIVSTDFTPRHQLTPVDLFYV